MKRDKTGETDTTFTARRDTTADDDNVIEGHTLDFFQGLPGRILGPLQILAGDIGGYAVDRLTHSLQTATRARHK